MGPRTPDRIATKRQKRNQSPHQRAHTSCMRAHPHETHVSVELYLCGCCVLVLRACGACGAQILHRHRATGAVRGAI